MGRLNQEFMHRTDIVHLTYKPPFAPGSFNRMVGDQLGLPGFRQAAISYWDQPLPQGAASGNEVVLINDRELSARQRAWLILPERIRSRAFNGVGGRQSLIYFWGALAALQRLRPKVVICHDNFKLGLLLRQGIDWPCRLILWQHGLSYYLPPADAARLYSLKSFDQVCVGSLGSYRFDLSRMTAYEPLVQVMPNWVDMERFTPVSEAERQALRARWDLPPDKRIVLWLSRLVPKKGAHALLQSWPRILRECPDAFLWIVGGGEPGYQHYLKSQIEALGLGASVLLQGVAPPELNHTCYQASDLFAFSTLFAEGFSFALLEAMACGLACVATRQAPAEEGYPPEIITLVSDANLPNAFAAPVASLLLDSQRRLEMARAARAFVKRNYSQETMLEQLAQFYRQQMSLVVNDSLTGGQL